MVLPEPGSLTEMMNLPEMQRALEIIKAKHQVLGVALASIDGVPLAAELPNDMEQQNYTGLSAGMLAFAHAILSQLTGQSTVTRISIHHDKGKICLRPLLDGQVVLSLLSEDTGDDQNLRELANDAVALLGRGPLAAQ